MFWGLIMESGKRYTQTVERAFHVSMACLEPNTADNDNVSVMLIFDNREFILCNLNKHKAVQSQLDLNFQSGDRIAFMSSGKGRVHLTGYLLETDEDEDDDMSTEDLANESSKLVSDSPKKSNSVKGTSKRKNEPPVTKSESKKVKLEPESPGKLSSEDDEDEDDDDEDDESILGEESDDLFGGNEIEEDEDDEDEDEDSEEDEDDSDEEIELLDTSKSKALNMKKKDKQMNKLVNESQQNKNKSPNEKQKNKSLIEKQQKNKTPNEKPQQKSKTPNEKLGGNTPHQKTPGNQMNGMQQQQLQQSGKKNKKGMDTPKGAKTPGGETPAKRVLEGGVVIEDLKIGNGPVAKPGRQVSVYYVGRLKSNNKQFDSTTEGAGFKFRLGRGEVIKGWDIGVSGMKVGGKRKVVCPAALAYGNKGSPPAIPPNSTLVFDVELKGVN